MGKDVVMTQEGYDKLQEKLTYLQKVRKLEVAEHLKEARELGDLSENAEWDAAKEEQAILESEIKDLEEQLHNAVIIEGKVKKNVVSLGSKVKIWDIDYNEMLEYTIVGTVEANIAENKISNECALAKGILGRKKGELCDIAAPDGSVRQVEIKEVK